MIPQEHAGSIIFNNNRYNLLEFKFAAIAKGRNPNHGRKSFGSHFFAQERKLILYVVKVALQRICFHRIFGLKNCQTGNYNSN